MLWSKDEAGCRGNPTLHGGPLWGGMCGRLQGEPPSAVLSPPGTRRAAHSKAGLSPGHGVGQRCVAGLGGDTCTEKEFITASV